MRRDRRGAGRNNGGGLPRLRSQALHSQIRMHQAYGGVVPELASRDHVRRVLPLLEAALADAALTKRDIDVVAFTRGPGLAGALLVGAGVACALAASLGKPTLGVHHLEGHLMSPFLSADPPEFPFVALLVSGGHTQLMRVEGVGRYEMLGETIDDAAGEAFDKSAKLLGLGYPGGPALAALAERGNPEAVALPRPLLHSGDLDFSFSGLKTAVMTAMKQARPGADRPAARRPGGEHAGGDLRGAGQEVAAGAAGDAAVATRRGGRRRRQRAIAWGTERGCGTARTAHALSGVGAVHRQRRDDRAGRRACGCRRIRRWRS